MDLALATPADARTIADLRLAAGVHLTAQYGQGPWSAGVTEKGVLFTMRQATLYIAHHQGELAATFTLGTRKPWAIDKRYFASSQRPLYLTAMAVLPNHQGQGLGRACLVEAERIAQAWPADAIRLDAYDAPAGAGAFYTKCGFREVGRAAYRGTPLIYCELLLDGGRPRVAPVFL